MEYFNANAAGTLLGALRRPILLICLVVAFGLLVRAHRELDRVDLTDEKESEDSGSLHVLNPWARSRFC